MKKNILITGASGNLGKASVEKFVAAGYRVIATVSPGKKLPFEITGEVIPYEADLTNELSVKEVMNKIINQHQTIDAVLLLVGAFAAGTIDKTDGDTIKKMVSLNFDTAYNVARPVFQHMIQQGTGGRLVFIGSRPALVPNEGKNEIAYALSKTLVFKLAELLNAEGKEKNVISSVIVPGTIDTPTNRNAIPNANFSDWVTPEVVADAMVYLLSDSGKALREPVLKLYSNS